jgi:arylsulfatase A-like enzyme
MIPKLPSKHAVGARMVLRLTFAAALLLAAGGITTAGVAADRPNVVIILADDLGIGDVSAYNERAAWKTPHLDRLAAAGITFSDAHTSAAICTPTRYGIMTGRYNWRSRLKKGGFNGASRPLIESERITLAKLFKGQGYHTAIVGKWHLGWDWAMKDGQTQVEDEGAVASIDFSQPVRSGPREQGFEYSFCLPGSLSSPPYVYLENGRPTSILTATSVSHDEKAFWRKGPKGADFHHADVLSVVTDRSVEYIRRRADGPQPFFLYVALTAPHAPIIPTQPFIGTSNANAYGDFVLQVDHAVGRITGALAENARLKNTLVFFTSDNGQSPRADFHDDELTKAGHNGSYIYRGKKFDIYEGGHRVPFLATWPGRIAAGTRSDETICTVDFMATAADLLGVRLSDDTAEDSYSLLPVLTQRSYRKPLREATVHHSEEGRFAIRRGDWKLILWPGSGGWAYPKTAEQMKGLPPLQLYNLREDPAETTNRVGAHPELVAELRNLLASYVRSGRSTPGAAQHNDGPAWWPELSWMEGGQAGDARSGTTR